MTPGVNGVQPDLSTRVADIEACLSDLDLALASGDAPRIEAQSGRLQRTLADALDAFRQAMQSGREPLTPALRRRLSQAQTRTQALQGGVHQASASVDRTLGMLFPQDEQATYGALGHSPAARALNKAYR